MNTNQPNSPAWQTYTPPQPVPTQQAQPMKQSGFGMASLIMAILLAVCMFILFVVAGVMENSTPGGIDEDSTIAMVIGMVVFALGGLEIVAFILGVVGVFQSNRKKLLAVLGIVLSALTLLGVLGLIVLGLAMS